MILDTSAIIAILTKEPGHSGFEEKLASASRIYISAATVLEASMVAIGRLGSLGEKAVARILDTYQVTVVPVGEDQVAAAIRGFARFGKGRNSAKLNFGDGFVYGLSKTLSQPVLGKGDEFGKTDISLAWTPDR